MVFSFVFINERSRNNIEKIHSTVRSQKHIHKKFSKNQNLKPPIIRKVCKTQLFDEIQPGISITAMFRKR
jgi:hypothetical protein